MLKMKRTTFGIILTSTLAFSAPYAIGAEANQKPDKSIHHLEPSHYQDLEKDKSKPLEETDKTKNPQQTIVNEQILAINQQNPERVQEEVVKTAPVRHSGHVHNIVDILDEGNALPLQREPYTTSSYYYTTGPTYKAGYYYGQGAHYTHDHLAQSFHKWHAKWHYGHHGFHHFNHHHWAHHAGHHAEHHEQHHEHHKAHHGAHHSGHHSGHHGGHHEAHHSGHHGGHHGGGHHR